MKEKLQDLRNLINSRFEVIYFENTNKLSIKAPNSRIDPETILTAIKFAAENGGEASFSAHYTGEGLPDTLHLNISSAIPFLYSMSHLTESIRVAGYNNNDPFIPLMELAKVSFKDMLEGRFYTLSMFKLVGKEAHVFQTAMSYNEKQRCFVGRSTVMGCEDVTISYQADMFELLRLWRFDVYGLIETGQAIAKTPTF